MREIRVRREGRKQKRVTIYVPEVAFSILLVGMLCYIFTNVHSELYTTAETETREKKNDRGIERSKRTEGAKAGTTTSYLSL